MDAREAFSGLTSAVERIFEDDVTTAHHSAWEINPHVQRAGGTYPDGVEMFERLARAWADAKRALGEGGAV